MKPQVLVDTGPIVAILRRADQHHERCSAVLRELSAPLVTCWPVLTEAAWLLRQTPSAVGRLLLLLEGGLLALHALDERDAPAIAANLNRYRSLHLQLADAALLHLAERDSIETVFTLDRRDFEVLRLGGGKRLRLLP